ncbi:hypothetical protein ABVK25_000877 [Lepraria finkii]|uniref:C2H2-type domain-containing protein n=1 Tax=Lepraria finkii TaxID=1340010 RepID=A0ABR4BRC5_9LECA
MEQGQNPPPPTPTTSTKSTKSTMPHSNKANLTAHMKGFRLQEEYDHMKAVRIAAEAERLSRGREPARSQTQQTNRITKPKAYTKREKRATLAAPLNRELSSDSEADAGNDLETLPDSTIHQHASDRTEPPQYPYDHQKYTTSASTSTHPTLNDPSFYSPYYTVPVQKQTFTPHDDQHFGHHAGDQPRVQSPPYSGPPWQPLLPVQNSPPFSHDADEKPTKNDRAVPAAGENMINPVTGRPFRKAPTTRMIHDAYRLAAVNGVYSPDKRPGQDPIRPTRRGGGFHEDRARNVPCPRCGHVFANSYHVQSHFPKCIEHNGNPEALTWDEGLNTRHQKKDGRPKRRGI